MRRLMAVAVTAILLPGCAAAGRMMFPELAADAERQGTVEEKYDEFRDVRTWHLVGMNVAGSYIPGMRSGSELRLGAIATYNGPGHPERPNTSSLALYLASTSADWRYLRSSTKVDLLVDGERLHLGEAARSSKVHRGYVTENMILLVERDTLQKIAGAQTVAGQLASTRFELQPLHLEKIRAFLAAIPAPVVATP